MALLEVKNLSVGYQTAGGLLKAVDNVSFTVEARRSLGLVGESGCGKTTIGMALMGLLPENGKTTGGEVLLDGEDLLQKSEDELRRIRWKEMSMIFQAAMNALNPVRRVGDQLAEAILTHEPNVTKGQARKRVENLFHIVGMDTSRIDDFPHQYSGGMKQRAVIAMALALGPRVIIADEPTTALDVIVQDRILQEIINLQKEFNLGMVFISHDISIVAEVCHQIGVMYAGQLVEIGSVEEVFYTARHPYTQALLNSFPTLEGEKKQLKPIPGESPNLIGTLPACRYCSRCSHIESQCSLEKPHWQQFSDSHYVLCDHCHEGGH